jgi:hypothetical protein
MAGSPLKRQRKLGVRDEDGSVIAFPYMPRVADLPRGWRHWSPAEKIEHLLGMSLDELAQRVLIAVSEALAGSNAPDRRSMIVSAMATNVGGAAGRHQRGGVAVFVFGSLTACSHLA